MAEIVRYVNAAASPGGNGTTPATTGANRAYSTRSEWEADEQTDLVSDGDTHVLYCEGTTADTTDFTINGWTTGASNGIRITGENSKHDGIIDGSKGCELNAHLRIEDNYVTFEWQYVRETVAATAVIYIINGTNTTIRQCISHNDASVNNDCISVSGTGTSDTLIVNTFCWQESSSRAGINMGGNTELYFCSVRGGGGAPESFRRFGGTVNAYNCVGYNNSGNVFTGTVGGDYNASDDTSGPGANAVDNITPSNEFVDSTNGDLHLASGSNLEAAGNAYTSITTIDVDEDTRDASTPDIGYDEFVSVGGATGKSNPLSGVLGGPLAGPIGL